MRNVVNMSAPARASVYASPGAVGSYWLQDAWNIESNTGGLHQAKALGDRESAKLASTAQNPTNSTMNTGAKAYQAPAAYMGVWHTKTELAGGRECALPAQVYDPKPWLYPKSVTPHFIRTI